MLTMTAGRAYSQLTLLELQFTLIAKKIIFVYSLLIQMMKFLLTQIVMMQQYRGRCENGAMPNIFQDGRQTQWKYRMRRLKQ